MMIPPSIAKFFASVAGKVILAALAALAAWWLVSSFISGQQAKREAKLAREEAAAVLDSVDVANRIEAEADKAAGEISDETKALADQILTAPPGNSNAAAVSAVCKMRAYKDTDQCKNAQQ